jgi:hypothetical protein
MNDWLSWGEAVVQGIPALFTNPFTYILLLIVCLQWKKEVDMQRKLFALRLQTWSEGILQNVFWGAAGGLVASVPLFAFGVVFSVEAVMMLWGITLILSLIRLRFLCFAYGGAILALLVLLARAWPEAVAAGSILSQIWNSLSDVHLPALFIVIAVLHVIESILIRRKAARRACPVYIHSKRGRLVGGYRMQVSWLVPLFLLVPGESVVGESLLFPGWPFVEGQAAAVGWSVLLVPALTGYVDRAYSSSPREKAAFSSAWLLLYSVVLAGMAVLSTYVPVLVVPTIVWCICAHEAIHSWSREREQSRSPVYVHPNKGLKILGIVPGSPADQMGMKPGETIVKVNGRAICNRDDLYEALSVNKAFCRLEVKQLDGEIKFLKRSLYERDHHQLGVLLAPDERVVHYVPEPAAALLPLLKPGIIKKTNPTLLTERAKAQPDRAKTQSEHSKAQSEYSEAQSEHSEAQSEYSEAQSEHS